MQAALSAALTLAIGLIGAAGLCSIAGRWAALSRAAAIAPSAAPPLAAILTWLAIFPRLRGIGAVVCVHAAMNGGLAAAALARAANDKIGGMAELALLEGASRRSFWRRAAVPALAPELATVFLFAFATAFSSFAIPLALGGARAATLEILIYERVRSLGDLRGGLQIAALQTFFVLGIAFAIGPARGSAERARPAALGALGWAPGLAAIWLPALALFAAFAAGVPSGLRQVAREPELVRALPRLAAGSMAVGIGAGLFAIAAFFALAFARAKGMARRLFAGYAAPSATLTGIALWLCAPNGPAWALVKIAIGVALLATPALNRLEWDGRLQRLEPQLTIARLLGASDGQAFWRISAPQLWPEACALAGLVSFWAWGDFALSSIATETRPTLAMAAAGLMDAYRIDGAMALDALALTGGAVTYFLFRSAGNVDRA